MQINNHVGRERADNMLLEAHYSFEVNLTMPQAAQLYLQADSILYQGLNYNSVCIWFELRGLYTGCVVGLDEAPTVSLPEPTLLNSAAFTQGEAAQLQFEVPVNGSATLYTLDGRPVWTRSINGSSLPVTAEGIAAGTYLLAVNDGQRYSSFKLTRQ